MPKRSASLKPSSRSFSRRRRSHTTHSSVKPAPHHGTEIGTLSSFVPPFSSSTSPLFSLPLPPAASTSLHSCTVSGSSASAGSESLSTSLTSESLSSTSSSLPSLIPPNSPFLSASASPSLRFSSTTSSDPSPSLPSKPCPSTPSSSLASPFVTETQQTPSVVGTYSPNSSASHDALYEYVKGLQEAIKSGDADFAERLLQELGEAANSPAAVSLIVSANGARLIASTVRQFRWHGLQKPAKGSMKGGRAGSTKTSLSAKQLEADPANPPGRSGGSESIRPDDGCLQPESCHSFTSSDHLDGKSLASSHVEIAPTSIVAPNESRRKRQRTSGELEEEDDVKEGFSDEIRDNMRAECSTRSVGEFSGQLRSGSEVSRSIAGVAAVSRTLEQDNVGLEGKTAEDALKNIAARVVRIRGRYTRIVGSRRYTREPLKVKDRTEISECGQLSLRLETSDKGDVFAGGSELSVKQEVVSSRNVSEHDVPDQGNTFCPECVVPGDANPRMFEEATSSDGTVDPVAGSQFKVVDEEESLVDQTCPSSGTESTLSSSSSSENTKNGVCDARTLSRPPNKKLQVDQSAIGLQAVLAQSNTEIGTTDSPCDSASEEVAGPSGQSIEGEVLEIVSTVGSTSATFESGPAETTAATRNHSCGAGGGSVDSENKGVNSKSQGMEPFSGAGKIQVASLGDKRVTSKWCKESVLDKKATRAEHSGSEEKKREAPSVYSLAKGAGMPDVVAEGCNALDKLATTAFRGKGAPAGGKTAAVTGVAAAKRGKTFSAEMYVALTEAFVDLLQVLKDNVALLSWCLGCLGSILPPSSSDRNSSDSSLSIPASSKAPYVTNKEFLKVTTGKGVKHDGSPGVSSQQLSTRSFAEDQPVVKEKETKSSKSLPKSATASYAAAALSAGNGKSSGNASSTGNGLASESTASSISALAAVAYAATVPMLAEKAVKAVLNAMQSCDIEAHSTHSALRALSAHLSSTNSKYVCDDAFAFIIAAMREFVSDAEMQAESCIALVSLPRAVSSATGHAAWAAITVSMDHHRTNLMVQRAGCGTLQLLCTRTGLGVPEWGSGKRPLRAAKDADRETGARALIAAMAAFPEDVRIQWHGCSTLWTLVHSAGVRSVANMVRHGAVAAVVGAMSVCRINELMQQEGCNVLGTMARTLAENGHDVGPLICPVVSDAQKGSGSTGSDLVGSSNERGTPEGHQKHGTGAGKRRDRKDGPPTSPDDWWAALWAVVSAMKAFNKSKSLQSNGTFALGCILKGSGGNFHGTSGVSPMPGMPLSNSKPSESGLASSRSGTDLLGKPLSEGGLQASYNRVSTDGKGFSSSFPHSLIGKDVVDDVERMDAAFEVTMTAMREFPKVETVQVWGCAVLQQAFLAYVHFAKRLAPVAMGLEASLSAALSAPYGASVFPALSTIFRTPSSFGNTDSLPKSSGLASTSTFPVSSAQPAPMNPKIPAPLLSSKSSSSKFSTAAKSAPSVKPDTWRFPTPVSSPGQGTDNSISLDRSEGKGAGENQPSSSLGVLQNTFSNAVPGPLDGQTISNEEVYFPSEKSSTSQSQSHPGGNTTGARSMVPIGCTPPVTFGETSGATKDHAFAVTAAPLFSAQKSPSKLLSFSSPASSAGLSRGSPCTPNLTAAESFQEKSEFKSLTNGHQFLGPPSPVEEDFGRGRSLFSSMPHSTSSIPQPSSLVAPPCDFTNVILSNATKAMKMISKTMKLSCSSTTGISAQPLTKSGSGPQAAKSNLKMTTTKSVASRSPTVSVNHSFASVRQSWCAALGAIGDVFGHLTRSSEVALGKGVPRGTDIQEIYKDRKRMHQLGIVEQPSEWNAPHMRKDNDEEAEIEHSDDDEEANVTLNALTIWTHTMAMNGSNLTQCSADVKAYMDAVVQQYKDKEKLGFKGKKTESGVDKNNKKEIPSSTRGDVSERSDGTSDWSTLDTVSQQQAVKDIKAWQEATESMGRIAERAGFPKAVKKSILAIRKILDKLEDAETVIWACHALVSLYLTWENVHLFRPGIEIDREEFKSRIWGIGEVGVQQLVDLVIHWTHQNRPDVTSLALQALYSACVFAATVQEIEEVFGPDESGAEAVIGAMQKALSSGGTAHQRRKVIQQACCVLTTVCGYSIRAQVAIAAAGGADVILAALDRYDEDNQIQVNGMHALGLDARLQPDFDTLWNAAIYRTAPGGVKWSRRKKGSSTSGATLVGLTHIYKEGIGLPTVSESGSQDDTKGEQRLDGSWTPQLERLLLDGAPQLGLFRTGLIASPGCGGPAFAVELFKRLGRESSCRQNAVEMQVHVCLVIGYMTAHDSKWRRDFIESGAVEAVLAAMEFLHKQNRETIVTSFGLMCDGVEVGLDARIDPRDLEKSRLKASAGNMNVSRSTTIDVSLAESDEGRAIREVLEARLQCAASWALAGLVKDSAASTSHSTLNVIQALAVALLRFGGITGFKPQSARAEKVHAEVCTPARLALARLGVFRIGSREQGRFLPHDAAEAGDVICLETLADKGVDLLMADSQVQTALMCAERAGRIGAIQFLREYAQLQGKRKAREKAKAKNKQGSRKTKSFDHNEISQQKSTVSLELTTVERPTVLEVQEVQALSSSPANRHTLVDRKVEDESDDRLRVSSAVVVTEKLAGEVLSSKEEKKGGAGAPPVAPVEETRVETKGKAKEKKSGKGQKVRDVKGSQEDLPSRHDEIRNRCGHPSIERSESQVDLVTREDRNNEDFAPQSREEIPATHQKASAEQVPAKAGDVGNSQETEKLNVMLRQAMSSGDVENLQAALSCCASSGSQADESLVKKVKAALAKRLKRLEKAAALQENLSEAIEEADSRRLREAISEIEKVPRFSVVFKNQLESAKVLLFDLETKERMLEIIDTQAASDRSSNLDEVHSIWSEENLEAEEDSTGRASEWSFVEREEKEMLAEGDERTSLTSENVESLTWTDVYKGKGRRKEKENGELSTGSLPCYREKKEKGFRCRRAKGALLPSDEEVASSSLVQLTTAAQDAPVQFSRPQEFSEDSLFAAEPLTPLSATASSEPIPPLLPIPPHASTVSPVLQPSRSVIMPPRASGRALYSPSGHEPITPQLFPVSKGGSLDHVTDHRWGGHFALDSDESPIGSHMARMFASQLSSPYRHDTFQQELQPGSDRRADQSGSTSDSSDSLASLLASIFQSNFSRSSFSTLFSTSFGEIPTSRTGTPDPEPGIKVVASPIVQPVLLSQVSTPVLNVHARPFLPAKTQKAAGPSLPHPSLQHGALLPVQYSSHSLNASEFPNSLSRVPSGSLSMSSLPGGLHQQSAMFHSSIGDQEVTGAALDTMRMLLDHHQDSGLGSEPMYHPFSQNEPSTGSSLQENALLAASMEESCCICFDMPKDAALIPCGHRMCKGCAEEMRRIRHHCPICNRSIDAVLALYG